MVTVHIATVSDQPALAPLVARWRVTAFFNRPGGYTVAEMTALILMPDAGPNETFVLFEGETPAGTVGLMARDLESRPDLTPWLGGLYVEPAFRGKGYASALVTHVEERTRAAAVSALWLYTRNAEGFYLRRGWERAGVEQEAGDDVILMRRALDLP